MFWLNPSVEAQADRSFRGEGLLVKADVGEGSFNETYLPRSSTRWILPVRVLGSSSITSIIRGTL